MTSEASWWGRKCKFRDAVTESSGEMSVWLLTLDSKALDDLAIGDCSQRLQI